MANMLFSSNSIAHFDGSIISNESWAFDANRVPYAIETPLSTICSSPPIPAPSGDEWWFHFRHGSNLFYANANQRIVEIVDSEGDRIFHLYMRNNGSTGYGIELNVDGGDTTITRNLPIALNQMRTYDIQLILTGVLATARVYCNKLLIGEIQYSITGHEDPDRLWLGGASGFGTDGEAIFSEIIIADDDTRNARLDLIRPQAAGTYTDWGGLLASLSDDDPTTGMTSLTANDEQTTQLEAYTGADNISNIVQVTTSVRGINSPTQLQHMIRKSATDYVSSNFSLPYEEAYQITDWTENPATSLPWVASDLTGMEFGFKSIA